MNEAETRAELIEPHLKKCGWGVVEGTRILREYHITAGRIQTGGIRGRKMIADFVLVYKGIKLAVVEAKSDEHSVHEGVGQAKLYAKMLGLGTTYSTNGKELYQICMDTSVEGLVENYLHPDALWEKAFPKKEQTTFKTSWHEKFINIPFEDKSGTWQLRYYQEIAINKCLEAIVSKQKRILLTLATGTGKTAIAFQLAWKLFQANWNLINGQMNTETTVLEERPSTYYLSLSQAQLNRKPRILFLADRNILADQAYNAFSVFPEEALVRIKPEEIRKKGKVQMNGSIFFTIFQTFMSGKDKEGNPQPYFGEYAHDFFDVIVIDECHRGGANDEGSWRAILEYFASAVQVGLTATPKRKDNVDTYKYFGKPVYIYSLKEGINDGFLTPFRVKRVQTTLDEYIYTSDDVVVEGEVEVGKIYEENDFNRIIIIKEREENRVKTFLSEINQREKTIVFCATQEHAALVRDLINQHKTISSDVHYCVRVTANDGEIGEEFLRMFQDNDKSIPTILTTSQKLSTGVDALNIRNIVLMRPINSMIEFKQIIGRGTRIFDGKDFFTIYDYVNAYHHFSDPDWDGEPENPQPPKIVVNKECKVCGQKPCVCEKTPCGTCGELNCDCHKRKKVRIKLGDGKEREIQVMVATSFWSAEGKPISAQEFLKALFGELPKFFQTEEELRNLWANPKTRKTLLDNLANAGFNKEHLFTLQQLINAEKSDLFDVLEYVFNSNRQPISRLQRAEAAKAYIFSSLNEQEKEFVAFLLHKYVESGVEELEQAKLSTLLEIKYGSVRDANKILGDNVKINRLFTEFQQYLYKGEVA